MASIQCKHLSFGYLLVAAPTQKISRAPRPLAEPGKLTVNTARYGGVRHLLMVSQSRQHRQGEDAALVGRSGRQKRPIHAP